MSAWILLGLGLVCAALTLNVFRPIYWPASVGFSSFFAGWLVGETALHHLGAQVLVGGGLVLSGGLDAWPGWVGLAGLAVSWTGLVAAQRLARQAGEVVEDALVRGLGPDYRAEIAEPLRPHLASKTSTRQLLLPLPIYTPGVERLKNIPYLAREEGGKRRRHCLDIWRARGADLRRAPVLLQVHGGGWAISNKDHQGRPLMHRMAMSGWVCAAINYRLAPWAAFPAQIIDVKRALAWLREHIHEYGGDPDFIVVTGGSAGAHLAALAALSQNAPEFQPGFEAADTSVQGCVSMYGVYDFVSADQNWPHKTLHRYLRWILMREPLNGDTRARYEQASPRYRISASADEAPAFMLTHGDRDSLIPVSESRLFTEELRRSAGCPVVYAEIPGAQHAFDVFPSVRSMHVVEGVSRWLLHRYSQWLAARQDRAAA